VTDEKLLHALGRVAAEQAREGERWEALAAAPPVTAADADDDARRLFTPPSDASVERMTVPVLALLAKQKPARRGVRWIGAGGALAAAAAVALFVAGARDDMPGYTLAVSGGLRGERGAEAPSAVKPLTVAAGTRVVLLARPDARDEGAVSGATFLRCGGDAHAVASEQERSEKGALRITLRGDDVVAGHPAGTACAIVLVVDRSPEAEHHALEALGGASKGRGWLRFEVPFVVAEAAP
jgi:hypothetical protein